MRKVTADKPLQAQLSELTSSVEICDPEGHTLGHILAPAFFQELMQVWVRSHISPEELSRRRQEPAGRSLLEIREKLEQS